MSKPTAALQKQLLSEEQYYRLNESIILKTSEWNALKEKIFDLEAKIKIQKLLMPKKEDLDTKAQELKNLKLKFDKAKSDLERTKTLSSSSALRKLYEKAYETAQPEYTGFKQFHDQFLKDFEKQKNDIRSDELQLLILKNREMSLKFELSRLEQTQDEENRKLAEIRMKQEEAIQEERELAFKKQRELEEARARAEFEAQQKIEAEKRAREEAEAKSKQEACDKIVSGLPTLESTILAWSKINEENKLKPKLQQMIKDLTDVLEDFKFSKWLDESHRTDPLFSTEREAFRKDIYERSRMLKINAKALLSMVQKPINDSLKFIEQIGRAFEIIQRKDETTYKKLENLLDRVMGQKMYMSVYSKQVTGLLDQLPTPPTDYAYLFLYVSDLDTSHEKERNRKLAEEERKRHEEHLRRIETQRRQYQEHCEKLAAELKKKREEEEHRAILHQQELQRQREALERAEEERQQQARLRAIAAAVPVYR